MAANPSKILASVLTAPLNQIITGSLHFAIRRLSTIWHHKQPLSGPKANFIDTSVFLSGVDRTCKNLPSREVAPIGRQALYKTEVAPVISTLEQPDTLGCSVFRCVSIKLKCDWEGLRPVKSLCSGLVHHAMLIIPLLALLKALQPKFHWLIEPCVTV